MEFTSPELAAVFNATIIDSEFTEEGASILFFDDSGNNLEEEQRYGMFNDGVQSSQFFVEGMKTMEITFGGSGGFASFRYCQCPCGTAVPVQQPTNNDTSATDLKRQKRERKKIKKKLKRDVMDLSLDLNSLQVS